MVIKEYKDKNLNFISVTNKDGFNVIFCDLGAAIYGVILDGKYLTQTPVDVNTYKYLNIYHGKTIGRVGNRIENASFEIDGVKYHLDANEGLNTLHSGYDGFSNKYFKYEIKHYDDYLEIIFNYFSKDMEGGFPGNFSITVKYTVFDNKDEILLNYEATCDKKCPIGLTNHAYFTLGSQNLNDLSLMIKADKFIDPRPNDLIPLSIKEVDKIMDFRVMKPIMRDINDYYLTNSKTNGYDHHFCYEKVDTEHPQVVLTNNRYTMEIYTDFNGLQIYTDNYEDDDALWHDIKGMKNRTIAIEPQDSLMERVILTPKDTYRRFIKYNFYRGNNK